MCRKDRERERKIESELKREKETEGKAAGVNENYHITNNKFMNLSPPTHDTVSPNKMTDLRPKNVRESAK